MKKVLSVVLAFVMIFSVLSVSMMAAGAPECDYTMGIGDSRTVYLPGAVYKDYVVVKFVPTGSGLVAISSQKTSTASSNPVLDVFKGNINDNNHIAEVENNVPGGFNFNYELNCEAGQVYYLVMHNSLNATNWGVSIRCLHETYDNGVCITCSNPCDHTRVNNMVGCCPCGESFVGSDLNVGETIQLDSSRNRVWFRFTPDETAPFILKSENPDDDATWLSAIADPTFIIVDETGENVLANDSDVSSDDKNFNFPFLFEKGERYFIGVNDKKLGSDDWYFTLVKGTSHTIEVDEVVPKPAVDEDGNPVLDEEGNPVYEVKLDAEGNPVLDAEGNPVYETVTVKVPVNHTLKYESTKTPTCKETGHTPYVYCPDCKDADGNPSVIAGKDEIAKVGCKDDNGDYKCDWCGNQVGEPPIPEDPTKNCSCNCHKSGISKFFFDFILFFQKIFRLNGVCKCGVRHW